MHTRLDETAPVGACTSISPIRSFGFEGAHDLDPLFGLDEPHNPPPLCLGLNGLITCRGFNTVSFLFSTLFDLPSAGRGSRALTTWVWYRGTTLIRKRPPPGPYSGPMPMVLSVRDDFL